MKGETEYISEGKIFHGSIPYVMGTRLEMLAVGVEQDRIVQLWDRLYDMVFGLDRMLNRFSPESEIYALNLSDNPSEMPMSAGLEEIVRLSDEYNERTLGLFDVMWHDGKFDFGGFGKGYFLKKCDEMLREGGVECAFVDFGGSSVLGIGRHPYGDSWQVGVVDPYTRMTVKIVSLADSSMSTSGNAPSYSGHVRDPRTGDVCEGRRLVTVVTPDPLDAEVLSTVLLIASEQERETILSGFPSVRLEILR